MPSKTSDEAMLEAIAEREQQEAQNLTAWARETLGLPIGCRVKVTISIECDAPAVDLAIDRKDCVYNQPPTEKDWESVFRVLGELVERVKLAGMWQRAIDQLTEMRTANNSGYIWDAGKVNAYFRNNGYPYKVVQTGPRGEDVRHSLFVAKRVIPLQSS